MTDTTRTITRAASDAWGISTGPGQTVEAWARTEADALAYAAGRIDADELERRNIAHETRWHRPEGHGCEVAEVGDSLYERWPSKARGPAGAKFSYVRRIDFGEGRPEGLPAVLTPAGAPEGAQIAEIFDALDTWAAPLIAAAERGGRDRGREDIRNILRDLIGERTARAARE